MPLRSARSGSWPPWSKAVLAVGFLALAAAVAVAHAAPASEYELSIYTATPAGFWLGVGVAVAAALLVAFSGGPAGARVTGLVLGGTSAFAIVALPVVRGYYYYGTGDALTHLGWARELAAGQLDPTGFLYPGLHTLAVGIGQLSGYPLRQSLVFAVLAFVALTLLFVPLSVWRLLPDVDAVVVAGFVGLLFLPLNNISTHLHAHPSTQTLFFVPFVLYLVFVYLGGNRDPAGWSLGPSAAGVLLALASVAAVLYHPLQGLNLAILLVGAALVQFVWRRRRDAGPLADHRPLYAQAAIAVVAFLAWTTRTGAFQNTADVVGGSLVGYLTGNPPVAAQQVQTQAASLQAIGVSYAEIFAKLFLVDAVVALVAAGVVLASLRGSLDVGVDAGVDVDATVRYLTVGGASVAVLMVALVFANTADIYFRVFGFLMVVATVLGSVGVLAVVTSAVRRDRGTVGRRAVMVAFALLLPLALAAVFPSPYLYLPNAQVSERQMGGHEMVLSTYDEDLPLRGVRSGPGRYSDAIPGIPFDPSFREGIPPGGLSDLPAQYDGAGYLVTSDRDYMREVLVYDRRRYSPAGFRAIGATPGVDRVESSGAVVLYHVSGS